MHLNFDKLVSRATGCFHLNILKDKVKYICFIPQILVLRIFMVSELMEGEQGHFCFLLSVRWKLANGFQ